MARAGFSMSPGLAVASGVSPERIEERSHYWWDLLLPLARSCPCDLDLDSSYKCRREVQRQSRLMEEGVDFPRSLQGVAGGQSGAGPVHVCNCVNGTSNYTASFCG